MGYIVVADSVAQLSRMWHCAPEETLNPIRLLKFTPETVVSNVFIAQVCCGRLFQTRALATAKLLSPNVLCVRGTAHDLSVHGGGKPASRTF